MAKLGVGGSPRGDDIYFHLLGQPLMLGIRHAAGAQRRAPLGPPMFAAAPC